MLRIFVVATLVVLLVACITIATGYSSKQTQRPVVISDFAINIRPFKAALDKTYNASGCTSPRPKDVGCTVVCKPCGTWICKDGKWVAYVIPPPRFCDSKTAGNASGTMCPRGVDGFCPAECNICY